VQSESRRPPGINPLADASACGSRACLRREPLAADKFEEISMKRIFGGMVVAAALSGSAFAADLGARTYGKAPAMAAPATNWSGLYIGGNVGHGWGNGSTGILPSSEDDIFPASTLDSRLKGVFGGAQIGYNWQIGSLVTGVEADIQGSGIRGSARAALVDLREDDGHPDITASTSSELSWFGTVRGRLGVTVTPDLLLYGTGGLAYGRVKASANVQIDNPPFLDTWPASISSTKTGWAAGAGAEWMFARNWSAKVEYLHIDLGSSSATAIDIAAEHPFSLTTTYSWNHRYDTLRVGVNYHFN
jgi:outer membrane immunogenic protein